MKQVIIIFAIIALVANAKANPNLIVKLDKSNFEANESISFDLIIKNDDEPNGYLLSNSELMALNANLSMHFYNLENLEINKGLIDSNQEIPPTAAFFILPIATYIGCNKTISISKLNLPPGKYKFKIWIPEMRIFDHKILKKAIKQFKRKPYLGRLEAEAEFIINDTSSH